MPHKYDEIYEEDSLEDKTQEKEENQDLTILPKVTFGILTDIQYADIENGTSYDQKQIRYYRNSLNLVKEAVLNWKDYEANSGQKIKFLIQLGDLVDGKSKAINDSKPAMHRVIRELNRLFTNIDEDENVFDENGHPKLLHIWGNHEMYNFLRSNLLSSVLNSARTLNQNCNFNANFYSYDVTNKLKLICLDFYEFSCIGYEVDDEVYKKALEFLTSHNKNSDLNSVEGMRGHALRFSKFNGSLSDSQLEWLRIQLKSCKDANKKAIVCGHIPIHAQASDPRCLAWNSKEVLEILWSFDHTVIAYFSGHDHQGGYFRDKHNIHHVTFSAILETPPNSNAFATVKVYEDKVSVEGVGRIGYYEIYFD